MKTPEVLDKICGGLAEGKSLRAVCRDLGLNEATVRAWEREDEAFATQSLRARETGCHALADECLEIADDGRNDWIEAEGGPRVNTEYVQRSRLRIDTRMRLLGKWLPKVYGEKLDVNHSGTIDLATRLAAARERADDKGTEP